MLGCGGRCMAVPNRSVSLTVFEFTPGGTA